jgi:sulfur relay (sulfurtransferase) complex TusBCD TusD component (DsrE family)
MKIGIIIETNDPEKAWNAVRFANTALNEGHEVKIFLMSAGVEIETIDDTKFKAQQQLGVFAERKGTVMACGTCLNNRNLTVSGMITVSTMNDCLNMVKWADRNVTF